MSDSPLGRRALLALYRNHPDTQPPERYTWKARAEARENRDMLLAWAATQSDERLLWCRNLGPAALAWIRSAGGDPPSPFADLEAENKRLREALLAVLDSYALDPDEYLSLDQMCRAAIGQDWPYLSAKIDTERLVRLSETPR